MKRYVLWIFLFALFILPEQVNGSACDNRTFSDFRSLVSNINIYNSYRWEDDKPIFDITISNIPDYVYIVDTSTGKKYDYKQHTSQFELVIRGYQPHQRVVFQFYSDYPGCYGQLIDTRNVTLPPYNEYSTDPICAGVENSPLCARWANTPRPYDKFLEKVNEFKNKEQEKLEREAMRTQTKGFWDKMLDFVGEYYIFLVGIVIVIIVIIAIIRKIAMKKNQFDFKV